MLGSAMRPGARLLLGLMLALTLLATQMIDIAPASAQSFKQESTDGGPAKGDKDDCDDDSPLRSSTGGDDCDDDDSWDKTCPSGTNFLVKFEGGPLKPEGGNAKGITIATESSSGGEIKRIGWTSSTTPIKLVLVKGGPTQNSYSYNNAFSGTGLTAPFYKGVSNVIFCSGTPTGKPDVELKKTGAPYSVSAGGTVTYSITAKNIGTANATGVVVEDVLPDDVWYLAHTTSKGSCTKSGATITCDFGTLAPGESATLTMQVRMDACGDIHNTATVEANEAEASYDNNTAWAETDVTCDDEEEPDLEITKSDNLDPAPAGSHLIYTVVVENIGSATAHNVVLTDTITHDSWRLWSPPSASQGTCSPADADTGDVLTCDLGDIYAGDSVTITYDVKPRLCSPMTNTAVVTSDEEDASDHNNMATETTSIDGSCEDDPDMSITTKAPRKSKTGKAFTYRLDVYQGGPEYGTGITVTDVLDDSVYFLKATASQGECSLEGRKLTCELGEMDVYTSAWVKIKVIGVHAGTVTNFAEVDVNEYDEDLSNNVSHHDTKVRTPKSKKGKSTHRYI